MAPFHDLLSKTDRALAAYVIATATGVSGIAAMTYAGKRSLTKSRPNITAFAESWTPDPNNLGSYIIKASINVITSAVLTQGESEPDRRKASVSLVSSIFDVFYNSIDNLDTTPIADAITAAARALAVSDAANNSDLADFKCDEFQVTGGGLDFDAENAFWRDTLEIELHCRPVTNTEP